LNLNNTSSTSVNSFILCNLDIIKLHNILNLRYWPSSTKQELHQQSSSSSITLEQEIITNYKECEKTKTKQRSSSRSRRRKEEEKARCKDMGRVPCKVETTKAKAGGRSGKESATGGSG
jgi:hypothetical protein